MVSGELFIGINFTAIALAFKNSTEREQSLHGNTGPMLIRFQYVRERIPTIMERIPAISECSHLGNPRYHTHTNYDEREESSSRTPKSRSRCTKYLSGSLIVCPVWRCIHVHYRQSISGRRSTHLRKGFFVSQNIPYWRYSHAPRIDRIDKRSRAILYLNRNLYTRWFMDVHGWYLFLRIRKFTSPSTIQWLCFSWGLMLHGCWEYSGMKPLSIYGFVHLSQGGGVSLAEGTPLSDEEQVRTVVILREHLMDVGDHNAGRLAVPGNGSNETETIESREGLMTEILI